MTLYEIDSAIMDCFDPETGELVFADRFEELQMERDQKAENIGCWIKDLNAEAAAIREEEKRLAERRKSLENKSESLKSYLVTMMSGRKLSTPRCAISWRKSQEVVVNDVEALRRDPRSDNYFRYYEPVPDKVQIKEALKAGFTVDGCELVTNENIQIK